MRQIDAKDMASLAKKMKSKPHYLILSVHRGPRRGTVYYLDQSLITLGNSEANTIVLNDSSISPHSSLIEYKSGCYWLSDLESVGGTWLRLDTEENAYMLEIGDVLLLANTELTVYADARPAVTGSANCSCSIM